MSYWNQHVTKSKLAFGLPEYYNCMKLPSSVSIEHFALSINNFRFVYEKMMKRELKKIEGHKNEIDYQGRIKKVKLALKFEKLLLSHHLNDYYFLRNTPIYS